MGDPTSVPHTPRARPDARRGASERTDSAVRASASEHALCAISALLAGRYAAGAAPAGPEPPSRP
jgi:hypothetical protein